MNTLESCTITSPYSKEEECGKFIVDELSIGFILKDIMTIGLDYTLRFWIRSEEVGSISVANKTIDTSSEWACITSTFAATSETLLFSFLTVGTYYIYHPKLELGDVATDWTPAPGDVDDQIAESIEAIDEFHNSSVDITNNGIAMKTTGSIRAVVDDVERLLIDEEGVSAPLIVSPEIRGVNLVTRYLEATVEWKGSIQASLDALPKYLTRDITLTIPAGTYAEDVVVRGFVGAKVNIVLEEGANINGTVSIESCNAVAIRTNTERGASICAAAPGAYTLRCLYCQSVELTFLRISGYRGRSTTSDGTTDVVSSEFGNLYVSSCCIDYSTRRAIYARGGTFTCLSCYGGCSGNDPTTNANLGYGVQSAHGAHGSTYSTTMMSVSGDAANITSTLIKNNATPTASAGSYVPATEVTKTFPISRHRTYLYGEGQKGGEDFYQGRYGTYESGQNGWRTGALWFASATSELAGKTIVSAKLTIRRCSSGWSSAVKVYLGTVARLEADYAATTTPTFTPAPTYPIGTLKREAEGTFDVTALMGSIQKGHALGVYEPRANYGSDSYSDNYTRFYGKGSAYEPVLTVTYK